MILGRILIAVRIAATTDGRLHLGGVGPIHHACLDGGGVGWSFDVLSLARSARPRRLRTNGWRWRQDRIQLARHASPQRSTCLHGSHAIRPAHPKFLHTPVRCSVVPFHFTAQFAALVCHHHTHHTHHNNHVILRPEERWASGKRPL